jgi:hypothetical protein
LKNSSQGISPTKFVRKLLNVRSPEALKFTEITALVPFSTATGDCAHSPVNELHHQPQYRPHLISVRREEKPDPLLRASLRSCRKD